MRSGPGFKHDLRRVPIDKKGTPWPDLMGPNRVDSKVTPGEYPTSLRWHLRTLTGAEKTFIDLLRMYANSPVDKSDGDAGRIVEAYDRYCAEHPNRKSGVDLDKLCDSLRISPAAAFGWFSEASFINGANIARFHASVRAPAVTRASIERALNIDEGFDDRKMLFETLGLIKIPFTRSTAIAAVVTPPDAGAAQEASSDPQTFEQQQRTAARLLRAPLKVIDVKSSVEEVRVPPSNHPTTTRNDR